MLFKLMKRFFKEELEQIQHTAYNEGYDARVKTVSKIASDVLEYTLTSNIGKKVVYIPNEWQDPDFYVITGVIQQDDINRYHEAFDVLKGEKAICLPNTVYLADEKMVKAILKLNPFERWNLSAGKSYVSNMWEKSYPIDDSQITPPDVLEAKLREVGFI